MRNKYRIVVWDLYPDALRTVGLGQNSLLWRFWAHVNRKAFAKAERVVTLCERRWDLPDEEITKVIDLFHTRDVTFDDLNRYFPITQEK